ncbi:MAG: glycosyltransferase family 2 protein [Thaumarchaeota archaeon]|nr:glycosyltransferase family 2 protein [Nitrososphaerota archaeon]
MPSYETITIARDEAPNLPATLESLAGQSQRPSKMIVVDDGSRDATAAIAERYGSLVVRLPRHDESYLGQPRLASVINAGLRRVSASIEYVVIVDADNPLPRNYVGRLLGEMERDTQVAAASGAILGEPVDPEMPRNSGFAVKASVWRSLNGMKYPLMYGYEAWLRFRLLQEGYAVMVYPTITSNVNRRTRLKGVHDGRAMYVLGYGFAYTLGRVAVNFGREPANSLKVLVGYLSHPGLERSDIADWVGVRQRRQFVGKARNQIASIF